MDEGKDRHQILHLSVVATNKEQLDALIGAARSTEDAARQDRANRKMPGRLKGKLNVGPDFFEPLSDGEIAALTGE